MCVEKYVVLWRLLDDELHLQPGDLHPNFFFDCKPPGIWNAVHENGQVISWDGS